MQPTALGQPAQGVCSSTSATLCLTGHRPPALCLWADMLLPRQSPAPPEAGSCLAATPHKELITAPGRLSSTDPPLWADVLPPSSTGGMACSSVI